MTIKVSPVCVDSVRFEVFVPGRVVSDERQPRFGYGTINLPIVITVRNNDGSIRDMSDVSSATINFERGNGSTQAESGTVSESASTVTCSLTNANGLSPAYAGQWYASVELDLSGGQKLFSNKPKCFYLVDVF